VGVDNLLGTLADWRKR